MFLFSSCDHLSILDYIIFSLFSLPAFLVFVSFPDIAWDILSV